MGTIESVVVASSVVPSLMTVLAVDRMVLISSIRPSNWEWEGVEVDSILSSSDSDSEESVVIPLAATKSVSFSVVVAASVVCADDSFSGPAWVSPISGTSASSVDVSMASCSVSLCRLGADMVVVVVIVPGTDWSSSSSSGCSTSFPTIKVVTLLLVFNSGVEVSTTCTLDDVAEVSDPSSLNVGVEVSIPSVLVGTLSPVSLLSVGILGGGLVVGGLICTGYHQGRRISQTSVVFVGGFCVPVGCRFEVSGSSPGCRGVGASGGGICGFGGGKGNNGGGRNGGWG
ncbi:hypothetical protein J437_LFUL001517 [Ladona fulva]|uniref:Uncharacterized protein n=1 Tax=Ladona fulva TaxID=123851 RepID=A0A8K0JWU4_LADFU|nr:hypothetical protein J437_LFUL001517 [Ladona fulva]